MLDEMFDSDQTFIQHDFGSSEICEIFTFDSADDQMTLEPVLNKFSEYCHPRKNVTILRHNFSRLDNLKARVFTILSQNWKS